MRKALICTVCLGFLGIQSTSFAYQEHEDNVTFFMNLIEADRLVYCKVFCNPPLCKARPFQTFCANNCESYVQKGKFDKCLSQRSVSIPPLHVLTHAAKGAEVGSQAGWGFAFGGLTSAATSWLLGDAARVPGAVSGIPGYLLGSLLGGIVGSAAGGSIAATEGTLLSFCYGMCSQKNCHRYPKFKRFCKEVCSNGREFSIKKCLEEDSVSKP